MSKKILIPVLLISLASNCVLGYYLHLAHFDLKCAEDINKLHTQEIKKLNQQLNAAEIPGGYEIEYMPLKNPTKNRVKNRTLPNIYIPPRTPEPYIQTPYIPTPAYIPQEFSNYQTPNTYSQEMQNYNLNKAAEALDGINTNMTINGSFPNTIFIYPYPEY